MRNNKKSAEIGELKEYFQQLFPNITYDTTLRVKESILNSEEYAILLQFLWTTCGESDISLLLKEATKTNQLSEIELRTKEATDKIESIKNKNKQKSKSTITIDQIVIGILYEFPALTIERIYDMNMFTLLHFWGYASRSEDHKVQIVAAGTGNIKEFTHFIK